MDVADPHGEAGTYVAATFARHPGGHFPGHQKWPGQGYLKRHPEGQAPSAWFRAAILFVFGSLGPFSDHAKLTG